MQHNSINLLSRSRAVYEQRGGGVVGVQAFAKHLN